MKGVQLTIPTSYVAVGRVEYQMLCCTAMQRLGRSGLAGVEAYASAQRTAILRWTWRIAVWGILEL